MCQCCHCYISHWRMQWTYTLLLGNQTCDTAVNLKYTLKKQLRACYTLLLHLHTTAFQYIQSQLHSLQFVDLLLLFFFFHNYSLMGCHVQNSFKSSWVTILSVYYFTLVFINIIHLSSFIYVLAIHQ